MQLLNLKKYFLERLEGEYSVSEIETFFKLLTEDYLGINRLQMALNPERELSQKEQKKFNNALKLLENHKPIQYIIGETEFFGLPFKVNPNVLIPRPETEELVKWVIEDNQSKIKPWTLLDIGTGSGCIAISLAKSFPKARVFALDVSEEAIETAKINSEENGTSVIFFNFNILASETLPGNYDVMISNPPYVREIEKAQMHQNVLAHEPEIALYVKNEDALVFYQKIAKFGKANLKENGAIYLEINQYLAEETESVFKENGFKTMLRKDIFEKYRMLKAY